MQNIKTDEKDELKVVELGLIKEYTKQQTKKKQNNKRRVIYVDNSEDEAAITADYVGGKATQKIRKAI
jgi:hypothetical protein